MQPIDINSRIIQLRDKVFMEAAKRAMETGGAKVYLQLGEKEAEQVTWNTTNNDYYCPDLKYGLIQFMLPKAFMDCPKIEIYVEAGPISFCFVDIDSNEVAEEFRLGHNAEFNTICFQKIENDCYYEFRKKSAIVREKTKEERTDKEMPNQIIAQEDLDDGKADIISKLNHEDIPLVERYRDIYPTESDYILQQIKELLSKVEGTGYIDLINEINCIEQEIAEKLYYPKRNVMLNYREMK